MHTLYRSLIVSASLGLALIVMLGGAASASSARGGRGLSHDQRPDRSSR
jgi:hypothetical protein